MAQVKLRIRGGMEVVEWTTMHHLGGPMLIPAIVDWHHQHDYVVLEF